MLTVIHLRVYKFSNNHRYRDSHEPATQAPLPMTTGGHSLVRGCFKLSAVAKHLWIQLADNAYRR